jgi:hypothetical protein
MSGTRCSNGAWGVLRSTKVVVVLNDKVAGAVIKVDVNEMRQENRTRRNVVSAGPKAARLP